ncbi:MAG TPA: DNA polymerase A family protein [Candidatus Acidoferrales bacterium]|nr:DNA polymerase A family protein [Candidatus Acidoferrales bacterium]
MSLLDIGNRIIVGIDCEGSPDQPWSAQISLRPGTGYMIRSTDTVAVRKLRDWLYASRDRVLVSLHYAMLNDFAQLRGMGIDIAGEDIPFVDTGILAYLLCVEPGGLKALCYRHAGMHQEDYSDLIGDVGHGIAMEYLRRVASAVDAPWVELAAKIKKKRKKAKEGSAPTLEPPPEPESTLIQSWPEPEPEIVSDGNGTRVEKPQGVGKLVTRIIADVESGKVLKDGSPVDPRKRWMKLTDAAKEPVIAVIGDMPTPTMDDIDIDRAIRYGSRDADAQFRITRPLIEKVKAMGLEEACRIDHGIVPMIDRMSAVGIGLAGPEFWDALDDKCDNQMEVAKWRIFQATGRDINPGSGDQVAELLYSPVSKGGLGLTPPRMTDGGESGDVRGSTDDKCLEELLPLSPIIEHIEDYREASKLKGTYVKPLRLMASTGDRRARATFKLTRQVTGRISTAEPMNLLSIPVRSELGSECRYGFVAPEGKVIHDADLSTVEMRTFAHLSRDEKLCEIFIKGHEAKDDEKLKWDVHTRSASDMFGTPISRIEKYQRQAGKVVNFFIINGGQAYGLRIQMIKFRAYRQDGSRWTEDDCQSMLDTWYEIYPGAKRFQSDCMERTRATGLAVDPLSGRMRYLPQIWSPIPKVRAEAERCSYAHLIQTSANTILKRAMMAMWDGLRRVAGVEPLLPVHDEVIHELPDEPECRELVHRVVIGALTTTTQLRVPLEAEGDFGPSWGAAKH